MRTVIGLIGSKGAGKDTVATFLERNRGVKRFALADKLKATCSDVLGIPAYRFDTQAQKEYPFERPVTLERGDLSRLFLAYGDRHDACGHIDPHVGKNVRTPRELLQYVGSEVLRSVDPDVHCKALLRMMPTDGTFVVTDIRFQNELDFFRKATNQQCVAVYVSRREAEELAELDQHQTERFAQEMSRTCPYRIDNDGTMAGLEDRTLRIFAAVMRDLRRGVVQHL
jgi:hypothetical protein